MSEGLVVLGFISLESASGKRKGEEEIRWKIMRCFCRKFCFSVIRNMFNQIKVSPETIWHVISTFQSFSPSLSLLYADSSVDLDCTSESSDEYIILRAFQWYLHYKVTVKLLLPLWCRINQNHSITALSSYHRYLRSISYEYFIFLIHGLVLMWSTGVVVTDQWNRAHSASCNYLQRGDTSSAECSPRLRRAAIRCEIHLGCHLSPRCMMGYMQSGCTGRVPTF